MANQQDIKTLLGKYYDEDAGYRMMISEDSSGLLFDFKVLATDEQYEEGAARFTSRMEIDIDGFLKLSYSESDIYHQPLDKIKKLSMYKELVNEYGFDDNAYLEGNAEALKDYYSDVISDDQLINIILQEDMQLDESQLQYLEEDGKTRILTVNSKILKVESKQTPLILEELNFLDDMLAQAKEEFEDLFRTRISDEHIAIHDTELHKEN